MSAPRWSGESDLLISLPSIKQVKYRHFQAFQRFQPWYESLVLRENDDGMTLSGFRALIAGRSIAGDKISHAAVRNMMCCTVTGQGAGIAAAVSVKSKVSTAEVRITDIQAELKRQGVPFH
jgi:hypothetical protein